MKPNNERNGFGLSGMEGMEGMGRGRVVIPRTFESFKNPQYRLYWAAMMSQMAANNMEIVARPWFMYQLTKSPAMVGLVSVVQAVPMLALSLFGGIIADRVEKKKVLTICQVASAMVALFIALSIATHTVTWLHLMVAGFLKGAIFSIMMPSRHAIIPEIVGEERLMNAVALNAAGMNINRLLAPAVAGLIIAGAGIGGVYYLMTGLFLSATIPLIFMARTGAISLGGSSALKRLKDGLLYVKGNTEVLYILILTLVAVLFAMPYLQLLPIYTEDVLGVSPAKLGFLISVSGVTALGGSLAIASMGSRNRGRLYLFSVLLTGVGLLALTLSPNYTFSLAAMAIIGLGQAGRMSLSNALVQGYSEDAYRGRVMALYQAETGITNLGAFGIAIFAQFYGVLWAFGLMSMALILMAISSYAFLPRFRQLD